MNRILGCAGLVAFLALSLSINAQDQTPPPPAEEALPQAPPPQYSQNVPHENPRWTENHGEFAAYGDFVRASSTNFLGVGGRVAFNLHPNVALEGEMNYDFAQN